MSKKLFFVIVFLMLFFAIHHTDMAYRAALQGEWFQFFDRLVYAGCNIVWLLIVYVLRRQREQFVEFIEAVIPALDHLRGILVELRNREAEKESIVETKQENNEKD